VQNYTHERKRLDRPAGGELVALLVAGLLAGAMACDGSLGDVADVADETGDGDDAPDAAPQPDPAPPGNTSLRAPTVHVSRAGRHEVTWTELAGAESYVLERDTDGTGFVDVAADVEFAFADDAIDIRAAYAYRVRACAFDACKTSPATEVMPAVLRLNGPLQAAGAVHQYRPTPDASRVVYRADELLDNVFELFVVEAGGGRSAPLDLGLSEGEGLFGDFQPTGTHVVFRTNGGPTEGNQMYAAPLEGGPAVNLTPPLVAEGNVAGGWRLAAGGARVIYRADATADAFLELFSAPVDGGEVLTLSQLSPDGDVVRFVVTPSGNDVVYRADQDTDGVFELYLSGVDTVGAVKLSGPMVAGGDVYNEFEISPDESVVVYRADQDTNGVHELYKVALEGGDPVRISGDLVAGGNVEDFAISGDGAWLVYRADADVDEQFELFAVPLAAGGAPVKVSGAMAPGGSVVDYQVSSDGARVVYRADQNTPGLVELYSAALLGDDAIRLNAEAPAGASTSSIEAFEIDRDGTRVCFLRAIDGVATVHTAAVDGSETANLTDALPAGTHVEAARFVESGSRVVFRATSEGQTGLYSANAAGGDVLMLNDALPPDARVLDFALANDGTRVLYRANHDESGLTELFSALVE